MGPHTEYPGARDHPRRTPSGTAAARATPLHDSVHEALRRAAHLARDEAGDGRLDDQARRALSRVCALAWREGVRVEALLVLLKDAWRRLPELQGVARRDSDVTLTRVITHCIQEYFRPHRENS